MIKKRILIFMMVFSLAMSLAAGRSAAAETSGTTTGEETTTDDTTASTETTSAAKKTKYWKTSNQKVYYINSEGKKAKGLTKIGGKYYYFDSKGVQRTGWQKIDGSYYYFKIANGKKGYMVKSDTVNGITLRKSGKAKTSGNAKTKLAILVRANQIVESITKPTMTKAQKLKACWNYGLKTFSYKGSRSFKYSKHWEQTYAMDMFDTSAGVCFGYASAFAYMANAVGYKEVYVVASRYHGWTEINGKIYDLQQVDVGKTYNLYGISYSLSKVGGRMNYKASIVYSVKI